MDVTADEYKPEPADERWSPWIVWQDYGSEGWQPIGFCHYVTALRYIQDNDTKRLVLTRRYELTCCATTDETPPEP